MLIEIRYPNNVTIMIPTVSPSAWFSHGHSGKSFREKETYIFVLLCCLLSIFLLWLLFVLIVVVTVVVGVFVVVCTAHCSYRWGYCRVRCSNATSSYLPRILTSLQPHFSTRYFEWHASVHADVEYLV